MVLQPSSPHRIMEPLGLQLLRLAVPAVQINVSINDVTYGNSTYVAVGQSGRILTSSNGTSWDNRSSGTTSNLVGVTYGNSKFLTLTDIVDNGTATVFTSTN